MAEQIDWTTYEPVVTAARRAEIETAFRRWTAQPTERGFPVMVRAVADLLGMVSDIEDRAADDRREAEDEIRDLEKQLEEAEERLEDLEPLEAEEWEIEALLREIRQAAECAVPLHVCNGATDADFLTELRSALQELAEFRRAAQWRRAA